MTRWILGAVLGTVTVALIGAAGAYGDGLPIPTAYGPNSGITGPDGTSYTAERAGDRTIVREARGDRALQSTTVRGRFTVPLVAFDGSPAGLSADGSTLSLIRPRASFPQERTSLLILDAGDLSIVRRLTLDGDFSFDAISPDGNRIFLIQYLSPRDPTRYAVRAYDVEAQRLVPQPIVDPNEPPGEMRGFPMTRETSADGRWAYTLYDGGGDEPFVHALDTSHGRAVCIDLDGLVTQREVHRMTMRLEGDGGELALASPTGAAAVIDTETLEARAPSAVAPARSDGGGGGGLAWIVVAGAVIGVIGGAAIGLSRRRTAGLATRDL
jgi:hypothetical protein